MHSCTRFGLLRMKTSRHTLYLSSCLFFPSFYSPHPPLFPSEFRLAEGQRGRTGRMGKRAQIRRQGFTERLKSVHECMKRTKEESQTSSPFPETMWSAHRSLTDTELPEPVPFSFSVMSIRLCNYWWLYLCVWAFHHSCHRIPLTGMTVQCSLWTLSPCWKTSLREVNAAQHLIVGKTMMISYKLSVPMMFFSPPAT